MIFAGQTIPFVLMPHFISPGQLRRVKHAVGALSAVLDRFCDAYPEDEALRDELAVSPVEDSLIRIDPGFPRPMRICRLDAFLTGYDVKFLEFNADSPAGIGYTDILFDGLRETITVRNHTGETVEVEVRLACGADFADLFEVKLAEFIKAGKRLDEILQSVGPAPGSVFAPWRHDPHRAHGQGQQRAHQRAGQSNN